MINTKDAPLVSAIIPTCNHAAYIAQAVESALKQTFEKREIIVIDDGSTDQTPEVLNPFLNRIRYHRQQNQGEPAARNAGVRRARGEFVAFLDADDCWHSDFLKRQVEEMRLRPDVALSFTAAIEMDEAGRSICEEYRQLPPLQDRRRMTESILRANPARSSACMFRRVFLKDEPFDCELHWGTDWDLILQTAIRHPVYYLRESLYYYRRYRGAAYPLDLKRGREQARLRILHRALDRLGDSIPEQAKDREEAIACTENACLRCASGEGERARQWMVAAFQSDPGFFAPPAREFVSMLGQFIENLYEFGTPPQRGALIVDQFFNCLPPRLGQTQSLRRAVLGHFLGVHTFGSYQRGRPAEALNSALRAVRQSPGWLLNRGFRSITARSALGKKRGLP